jgi:predicted small metal-binding protein
MICPFTANAPAGAELVKKIAEREKAVLKTDTIPPDVTARITGATGQ